MKAASGLRVIADAESRRDSSASTSGESRPLAPNAARLEKERLKAQEVQKRLEKIKAQGRRVSLALGGNDMPETFKGGSATTRGRFVGDGVSTPPPVGSISSRRPSSARSGGTRRKSIDASERWTKKNDKKLARRKSGMMGIKNAVKNLNIGHLLIHKLQDQAENPFDAMVDKTREGHGISILILARRIFPEKSWVRNLYPETLLLLGALPLATVHTPDLEDDQADDECVLADGLHT